MTFCKDPWTQAALADIQTWLDDSSCAPTSQISGSGAVTVAERRFSSLHNGRPALLVPSATYGMRCALAALGVGAGDAVLIPGIDWPSTRAAVLSLGGIPLPVSIDVQAGEITISPGVVQRTFAQWSEVHPIRALVATHLHGVMADIPALRQLLPQIPIIEDCAQALGSSLDGSIAGTLGDMAVFSFGPMKSIDVGEAGMILTTNPVQLRKLIALSSHPVRQYCSGIASPSVDFSVRPHPLAAVLLAVRLQQGLPRYDQSEVVEVLRESGRIIIGHDCRRINNNPYTPVLKQGELPTKLWSQPSGAWDIIAMNQLATASIHLVTKNVVTKNAMAIT